VVGKADEDNSGLQHRVIHQCYYEGIQYKDDCYNTAYHTYYLSKTPEQGRLASRLGDLPRRIEVPNGSGRGHSQSQTGAPSCSHIITFTFFADAYRPTCEVSARKQLACAYPVYLTLSVILAANH
jgi:hypothetical protein